MNAQLLRFLFVGGIGFLIDAGLVYLLSTYAGMSPIVARVPAICTAILVTWLLNRRLTFNVEEARSVGELARYASVAFVSAILNFCVYSALVLAGLLPVLAVAAATIALMSFSFFGYKIFAFGQKQKR